MLNGFKKVVAFAVLGLFFAVPVGYAQDSNGISIIVNDSKTNLKGSIVSDRTMVPLRGICEKLGSTVLWDGENKKITVVRGEKKLEMKLGEYKIDVDGHEKRMDAVPDVKDGTTFVPVRFLSENLGFEVEYNGTDKSVSVDLATENPIVIHNEREEKAGNVEVDLQYPQIEGLKNLEVQKQINGILKNHVEDFKLVTKDFENEVKELRKEGFEHNYGAVVNYEVMYNKNGLLSVVFTDYTYTGGAHGMYGDISYTFDLTTGETYHLEDLFNVGFDYKNIINEIVKEQFNSMDYILEEFKSISENQPYYLSNNGIVVYFTLYEYTPYAAGIPRFTIPYEQIASSIQLNNLKQDTTIDNEASNDCYGLRNEAQQKKIMQNLDTLINSNANEKQVITFVNNNIAYVSKENASKMVFAIETTQKKNISNYIYGMTDDIQGKIIEEFNWNFNMDKIDDVKNPNLKKYLKNIKDSGYRLFESEGMYCPIIDYARYCEYAEYVTDDIREYIAIMAEESTHIATDDAAIVISWDEVLKRACVQEEYIKKYPQSLRLNEMKQLYEEYVRYCLFGTNNTPSFDYQTETIDEKLLESYKEIVQKDNDNNITQQIKDYLKILENNKFKRTNEVESYINEVYQELTQ